jgi:hypothetical protein
MGIDHFLARVANSDASRLAKPRSRNEQSTFRIKDLTTGSTMVFSTKCGKGVATVEAVFGILIAHPEVFAKQLTS